MASVMIKILDILMTHFNHQYLKVFHVMLSPVFGVVYIYYRTVSLALCRFNVGGYVSKAAED